MLLQESQASSFLEDPLGLALTDKCLLQPSLMLKRTSSGMGGVFLFCPGTPWESGCLAGLWACGCGLGPSPVRLA